MCQMMTSAMKLRWVEQRMMGDSIFWWGINGKTQVKQHLNRDLKERVSHVKTSGDSVRGKRTDAGECARDWRKAVDVAGGHFAEKINGLRCSKKWRVGRGHTRRDHPEGHGTDRMRWEETGGFEHRANLTRQTFIKRITLGAVEKEALWDLGRIRTGYPTWLGWRWWWVAEFLVYFKSKHLGLGQMECGLPEQASSQELTSRYWG